MKEEEKKYSGTWIGNIEYFDVKALMEWVPLKARSIRKYLRKDSLRGKKIGRMWYVGREELYRWLGSKVRW